MPAHTPPTATAVTMTTNWLITGGRIRYPPTAAANSAASRY